MTREKLSRLIKKQGIKAFVYTYFPQTQEDAMVSSKIRFGQAKHLEKKGMIEEAIELYKQAANFFPRFGLKYFKDAAELAERNFMYNEASLLWLESLCYTPDFRSKLVSFRNGAKDLILDKLNRNRRLRQYSCR